MESFLDRMKAARTSRITIIDKFIRDYGSLKEGIFIFVEGKHDKNYHQNAVRRFSKPRKQIKLYICGNKKEVIKNESQISNRTLPVSVDTLYFVDSDFDRFATAERVSEDIHTTEGYSFENLIMDHENMQMAWESGVTEANSGINFQEVKRLFLRQYIKFAKLMLEFSSEVICRRKYPVKDQKIVLQDGKIQKLVTIDDNLEMTFDSNFVDDLSNQVGLIRMSVNSKCLKSMRDKLISLGSRCYIRGKYLTKFVQIFINQLIIVGKKIDPNFCVEIATNERSIVDYILTRGNIPKSLEDYINCRLSLINKR